MKSSLTHYVNMIWYSWYNRYALSWIVWVSCHQGTGAWEGFPYCRIHGPCTDLPSHLVSYSLGPRDRYVPCKGFSSITCTTPEVFRGTSPSPQGKMLGSVLFFSCLIIIKSCYFEYRTNKQTSLLDLYNFHNNILHVQRIEKTLNFLVLELYSLNYETLELWYMVIYWEVPQMKSDKTSLKNLGFLGENSQKKNEHYHYLFPQKITRHI